MPTREIKKTIFMLCPSNCVQGWLASMLQKTPKSKSLQRYIAVGVVAQHLVAKKKDGKCRPFV
jgi:hypothetical protein